MIKICHKHFNIQLIIKYLEHMSNIILMVFELINIYLNIIKLLCLHV